MHALNKNITTKFQHILASTYGITDVSGEDLIESISYEYCMWSDEDRGPFDAGEKHPYDNFVIIQKTKNNSVHADILEALIGDDLLSSKNPRLGEKKKPSVSAKKKPAVSTKKSINYDYVTDYCIKKHAIIVSRSGNKEEIFIFDRESGRYRVNNGDIERTITEGLAHHGFTASRRISTEIREIMLRFKGTRNVIPREDGLPFNFKVHAIPLRNGVYDIDEKRLNAVSPAYGFSYTLDVDFIKDIDTSFVENYLRSLVAPKDYPVLLQMVASMLLGQPNKQFYVLYNISGNNGKTTFQNFITSMVGDANVANLSIEYLTTHRFMLAELYGKVANIAGDIPQKPISDTSVLKQIVGDDQITAEKKGKDPFTFTNKSVNIFSANCPPPINDSTDAFWSRVVIVKFPNTFTVDPNFFPTLFTEENKSALLRLAIDYIPTLLEKGPIQVDIAKTEAEVEKLTGKGNDGPIEIMITRKDGS